MTPDHDKWRDVRLMWLGDNHSNAFESDDDLGGAAMRLNHYVRWKAVQHMLDFILNMYHNAKEQQQKAA